MGLTGPNPGTAAFSMPPDEATQVRLAKDLTRAIQQMLADGTLRALIDDLPASVTANVIAILAGGLSTTTVTASGAISGSSLGISGGSNLVGGITSAGVASTNVTLLPGTRSIVYVSDASGVIGQTTSSIVYKTNIAPVPYTAEQFLSVMPLVFEYIGQVDIRDNPANPNYDPAYEVPLEVGLIAEHLVEAGMPLYVLFEADGTTPMNIDYSTFGVHAALVIGRDHEARLRRLEQDYGSKA